MVASSHAALARALAGVDISRRELGSSLAALVALGAGCHLGSNDSWRTDRRFFTEQEMARLLGTTTVFFLRPQDEPRREDFTRAIQRAWQLTKIEVVPFSMAAHYRDAARYSYFSIESATTAYRMSSGSTVDNSYYCLTLVTLPPDLDEDTPDVGYCRIELHPTFATMQAGMMGGEKEAAFARMYQGEFRNWSPGFLATYLHAVQGDLQRSRRAPLLDDVKDTEELNRLREARLYVPDRVLVKFNNWTGDESDRHDPKELMSEYPYDYEIVSSERIDELVASSDKLETPLYLFDFIKASSSTLVSIYNYEKGIIYREVSALAYNLDSDDFDIF